MDMCEGYFYDFSDLKVLYRVIQNRLLRPDYHINPFLFSLCIIISIYILHYPHPLDMNQHIYITPSFTFFYSNAHSVLTQY